MSDGQHTGDQNVEISGRISIGRGKSAAVTLFVFTENDVLTRSISATTSGDSDSWMPSREIFDCLSRSETTPGKLSSSNWRRRCDGLIWATE